MNTINEPVHMIPIDKIRILNPRSRDPKKFGQVVESIRRLGLKKPIKVSLRSETDGDDHGYDLVYGQGRMEAFRAIGHAEIPAIVVDISQEDRLLMSLVENLARRFPSHGDIINEILRLKDAGYSNTQIAKKIDISDSTVGEYLSLVNAHEERLLDATLKGTIPLAVAVEISKAETPDQQRAFLKAYETGKLKTTAIRIVKQLINVRNVHGKTKSSIQRNEATTSTDPQEMVRIYEKQTQKMKLLVHKSKVCETKMLIVVSAFRKLLKDESFKKLLLSQNLSSLPQPLAERLS